MSLTAFTLGLALPYGTQPGVELAVTQSLAPQWFVQEHAVVSFRPSNHMATLIDVRVGRSAQARGRWTPSASVGVGYELRAQVVTRSVGLGTGSGGLTTELQHSLLPTLNGELAWQSQGRIGAYGALTLGRRVRIGAPGEMYYAASVGVRIALGTP